MFCVKICLTLYLIWTSASAYANDELNFKYRAGRGTVCESPEQMLYYKKKLCENIPVLILTIFISVIFLLILLGLTKGLLGLFYSPWIGLFGLSLLVDMPRPLDEYQEQCIKGKQVVYDVGGWPVHPITLERSVRPLSIRTEFCLNTVFFLALPLVLISNLCTFICCIKNYKGSEDNVCFKSVRIIRFMDCVKFKVDDEDEGPNRGPVVDVYEEDDLQEREDTEYVVEMMNQSRSTLCKYDLLHQ